MITYDQIANAARDLPFIWEFPTVPSERVVLMNNLDADDRVLDVECGSGSIYFDVLLPNGYEGDYVGYESNEAVDSGKFTVYHDWDELMRKEKQFDAVLVFNVLEQMMFEEGIEWLEKLMRNMGKKGTKLFIITPNTYCPDYINKDPRQKCFWPYYSLIGLLRVLGFNDIKLWRMKGYKQMRDSLEWNKRQMEICRATFQDWMGEVVALGKRK